ncbi:MAG TPA: Panacea domain-containing protein, partial [Stellaceae bacterium]|nr:Panacea domain-containing protein [Stellaceae bacterium]
GGQDRLRQMILYVSLRCEGCKRFGRIKLNKIIWKADFDAYAERKMPITGRQYQKLEYGPAAKEMLPLLIEMERLGIIGNEETDFGDDIVELRPIARIPPNLSYFSRDDIKFVEAAIAYYWDKTGTETSDDSHGIAWRSRDIRDTMYYELSQVSDEELTRGEKAKVLKELADIGIS